MKQDSEGSEKQYANNYLKEEKEMKEIEDFMVWRNLGVVDTIYEEDYEFSSSSSSLSPPLSPPHLLSRVEEWSKATGLKTDVCIRVHGKCFHLHKDPLVSKCSYLKRQLAVTSDVSISPPLKITAETFTLVADFCYGIQIVITPFNVAALRTAAELLEMSEIDTATAADENLVNITEKYFRRVVAVNRDYASVVFRSCLGLLPEAETMAFLASRCLEAWSAENDGDYDGDGDIMSSEDFKSVEIENFLILASSLNRRFKSHDLIYKIALLYLNGYGDGGKITEDEKVLICNFIDCDKLSPKLLLQAVQNPVMPLRFIVRAMLIEQLNTRRSIFTSTGNKPDVAREARRNCKDPVTLGAILKREAATRESAKLKAAMRATNSRIQSLEKELNSMKMKLQESEDGGGGGGGGGGVGRSVSFHYGVENKVARGERGSNSSSILRFGTEKFGGCRSSSSDIGSPNLVMKTGWSIGQRLMKGIKNVFRVSGSSVMRRGIDGKIKRDEDEDEEEDVCEEEEEEEEDDGGGVVIRRNQLYVN